LAAAAALRGWVHAVNVTDGSRAVMRMSSLAVCRLLLDRGVEPVLQVACRDGNRIALQADLLGAHALGLRNVLCLTGDPVRAGDQPQARAVNELEAVRLLQLVAQLNAGIDPVQGDLPDGPTALFAGAAADPQSASWSGLESRIARRTGRWRPLSADPDGERSGSSQALRGRDRRALGPAGAGRGVSAQVGKKCRFHQPGGARRQHPPDHHRPPGGRRQPGG
jgi:hypothetical protein